MPGYCSFFNLRESAFLGVVTYFCIFTPNYNYYMYQHICDKCLELIGRNVKVICMS